MIKEKKAILGLTCPTINGDEVETIIRQQAEALKKQGVKNIVILTHSDNHLEVVKKLMSSIPELTAAMHPEDIRTLSNRSLIGQVKVAFDDKGNIIK